MIRGDENEETGARHDYYSGGSATEELRPYMVINFNEREFTNPSVGNVSITELPPQAGSTLKGHWNYSDVDGDLIADNETIWYINKSIILTAYNNSFLNAPNVTLNTNITFSARVKDSTGSYSNWTLCFTICSICNWQFTNTPCRYNNDVQN